MVWYGMLWLVKAQRNVHAACSISHRSAQSGQSCAPNGPTQRARPPCWVKASWVRLTMTTSSCGASALIILYYVRTSCPTVTSGGAAGDHTGDTLPRKSENSLCLPLPSISSHPLSHPYCYPPPLPQHSSPPSSSSIRPLFFLTP